MFENNNPIWYERYRPKTLKECILPRHLKETFAGFIARQELPNLILNGRPGTGKTTASYALCNELGYDLLYVNGSDEGRSLDTLRNDIQQHASTVSFSGSRKIVLLDEGDALTDAVQMALRGFIETMSSNCGFIITCNYKHKIIAPLSESRFSVIDFVFPKDEVETLQGKMFLRCCKILKELDIPYDEHVLVEHIVKHFPDFRRILNDLQKYAARGKIDSGLLSFSGDIQVDEVVKILKSRNFKDMRKWAAENDVDFNHFVTTLYRYVADGQIESTDIPRFIVILNQYQTTQHLAADREVFVAAFLTELMSEVTWK